MQEIIKNLVVNLFSNPVVATIFISMFPVIEVKGAIPFGQSSQFWGVNALSPLQSLLCALLGCLIISTILLALSKLFLKLLSLNEKYNNFTQKIKTSFKNKIKQVEKENKLKTYIYLFIFVAIPLPLTGIWSGCLIAALLNLDYFKSLICVNLGNVVAGFIIYLISYISQDIAIYIFYFFAICLVLTAVYYITKIIITNIRANKKA